MDEPMKCGHAARYSYCGGCYLCRIADLEAELDALRDTARRVVETWRNNEPPAAMRAAIDALAERVPTNTVVEADMSEPPTFDQSTDAGRKTSED